MKEIGIKFWGILMPCWIGVYNRKSVMTLKSSRFLAEMQRFELWRRFEPTYCISSADPSTTWVHLQVLYRNPITGIPIVF